MDALDEDGTTKNPFEGGAYRWEAVTVLNHVVISNGVDLPIVYKAEWDYARPLYNLREQGVVSCKKNGSTWIDTYHFRQT